MQALYAEAINILNQEGFVTKLSGRSARVLLLSELDVVQLYQLRGAVEGLAARLAASSGEDISPLYQVITEMRVAVASNNVEVLLDGDLRFHLGICEASGNPFLLEHARRILLPFFAFVRMKVITNQEAASTWGADLDVQWRILDLIRDGEGEIAEQYLRRAMERFVKTAYDNWESRATSKR